MKYFLVKGIGNKERNIFEKGSCCFYSQAKPWLPLNEHVFYVKILGQNPTREKEFFQRIKLR